MIDAIIRSEALWPYNAHLLEHPRIEDYVRFVLRGRGGDATYDGPALITPIGLGDTPSRGHRDLPGFADVECLTDLQTNVAMYPVDDPAVMIAKMAYIISKGNACNASGFACATCSHPLSDFEILWVSAPPSIIGVPPLCSTCAPAIILDYNPVRI